MSIAAVSSSTASSTPPPATTQTNAFNAFGSTQFMQMLMAQMTHQNPLEPMNDTEMMSQYSQLNSLQELTSIKTAMMQVVASNQTGYAASLIGKNVKATGSNGKDITGIVTGVTLEGGKVQVHIGKDATVAIENVYEIQGS